MQQLDTTGRIFDIQRFSVHDGPGIRTIVFLKGCVLRCKWCCNPESQEYAVQQMKQNGKIKTVGRDVTVREVLQEVEKDRIYYRRSGGGVTFGGGEPTAAGAFLLGLLDASIRRGYHICLDTCGVCEPERFRKIMNQVELFLFDCKHMDPDEHKRLTGLDNVIILQNLHALFEAKKTLRIRVPLMPGINDTEKNIAQMAAFLHKHGHNEVDVLPCHTFGHSKYAALNLADPVMVPYQPEELAAALERFAKYDLKVTIV